jgi:DNA-binding PadR family transcriptional regulator
MGPEGEVGRIWSVRRPLVYRAIDNLSAMDLVRPAGTVPSRSGPQRTVLEATSDGKRALTRWLRGPVAHVRDARSLLMLKLLFLTRAGADLEPLLTAQRMHFSKLAERLTEAAEEAGASTARCSCGAWRARRRRSGSSRRCSASRTARAAGALSAPRAGRP